MATNKIPKVVNIGEDRTGHPLFECGPFVLKRRDFDMPIRSFDYEVWFNFECIAVVDRINEFRAFLKNPAENPIPSARKGRHFIDAIPSMPE